MGLGFRGLTQSSMIFLRFCSYSSWLFNFWSSKVFSLFNLAFGVVVYGWANFDKCSVRTADVRNGLPQGFTTGTLTEIAPTANALACAWAKYSVTSAISIPSGCGLTWLYETAWQIWFTKFMSRKCKCCSTGFQFAVTRFMNESWL